MFEVIQYILDTQQDAKLYYNQEKLVLDLIDEQFTLDEIMAALDWFYPIIDASAHHSYHYQANAIRGFDYFENKYLSKAIINKILSQERTGIINQFIRDILIDRMSLVAQSYSDENELNELLDDLITHVSQYKFGMVNNSETKQVPTIWSTNFTLH